MPTEKDRDAAANARMYESSDGQFEDDFIRDPEQIIPEMKGKLESMRLDLQRWSLKLTAIQVARLSGDINILDGLLKELEASVAYERGAHEAQS